MNNIRILIYIDILGFYELAKEIAQVKNLEDFRVRSHFIKVIQQKIEKQEKNHNITVIRNFIGDDWLLLIRSRDIIDSIDLAYRILIDILDHQTFFKESDYERIPLEIGLGTIEWKNEWDNIDDFDFNRIEPTILFLKSNLINYFHKWYRENKKQRIKSTFIIFTKSLFNFLDYFDKNLCEKISFYKNNNEIVFYEVNVNEIINKGKIYTFLEKIEEKHNRFLAKINQLFVPPFRYEDIKNALKKKGIIFISGSPEYGKTFTSLKIMWDFFNNYGYNPKWLKGSEPIERKGIRERLENIKAELKEKTIIYFEDPFGKIQYEPRESLEREIKTIIEIVNQTKDLYVIITSREEIFEIFKRKSISKEFIEIYEKKINFSSKSYDYQKRKQILINWALLENSKWLNDDKLKNMIIEAIKKEDNLPTILNIRDFVLVTCKTVNLDELKSKLLEKSEETRIAFSQDIKKMSYDKQLFLFLIYLLKYYKVEFIQKLYNELIKELEISDALDFFEIVDHLQDKKINYDSETIRFTHPSYRNALDYLVNIEGYFSGKIRNKFSDLVVKLSNKKEAASRVVRLLMKNFNNLIIDPSDLLLKMVKNDETAWGFIYNLSDYFNKIPEDFRNIILEILSQKNDNLVYDISNILLFNFYKVPDNVRNLILTRIAKIGKIPEYLTWVMEDHFDEIPENLRNDLLKILAKEKYSEELEILEKILIDFFDIIPKKLRNEILIELLEDKERAYFAIAPTLEYFNQIPQKIHDKLYNIAESESNADRLATELSNNFLDIPKAIRENLVLKLSKIETEFMDVVKIFRNYYNELPEKLRNEILLNLQDKEAAAYEISNYIIINYNELPKQIKSVIFNLANNEKTAWGLPAPLIENFSNLPDELKELFFKICNEKQSILTLPWILTYHYDKIKKYSKEILFKLIDKKNMANNVAWALAHNFSRIPNNLSNDLINKLINKTNVAEGLLAIFLLNRIKISAHVQSKILENISENFKELRNFLTRKITRSEEKDIIIKNESDLFELFSNPDLRFQLSFLWSKDLDWVLEAIRDNIQTYSEYYKKWLDKLTKK